MRTNRCFSGRRTRSFPLERPRVLNQNQDLVAELARCDTKFGLDPEQKEQHRTVEFKAMG